MRLSNRVNTVRYLLITGDDALYMLSNGASTFKNKHKYEFTLLNTIKIKYTAIKI